MKTETIRLTAKEQRLYDYIVTCNLNGITPTFGEICEACHTTVFTLLGKTYPSLLSKLGIEP